MLPSQWYLSDIGGPVLLTTSLGLFEPANFVNCAVLSNPSFLLWSRHQLLSFRKLIWTPCISLLHLVSNTSYKHDVRSLIGQNGRCFDRRMRSLSLSSSSIISSTDGALYSKSLGITGLFFQNT